jgi:hypothetical protein
MPLYIFSAQVGDTWQVGQWQTNNPECPYSTIKVINTGTIDVGGQSLRWLEIVPGDSSSSGFGNGPGPNDKSIITEKIGTTGAGYFLPIGGPYCLADSITIYEFTFYNFNCFSNSQFSYNETADCDGPLAVTELKSTSNQFSIFPNPSQGITNINPANNAYSYNLTVYDIAGRQLHTVTGLKGNYQLDTQILPKGLYTLRIEQDNKQYYHKLMVN